MRDLIFVSLENWDEVWRRNQFVCAELARRFPDRRILFVGKPLFGPQLAQWSRTSAGRVRTRAALRRRFWRVPKFPNIHFFSPLKPLPNPVPGGRALNEAWLSAQIRGAARRVHIRDPLLWINPYDSGFLIGRLGERGTVYDITDDWALMNYSPAAAARIAAQDRDLCERADLTIVCSPALFESRRKIARRLVLIPNGVEAAHYARIDELDKRAPGTFNERGVFQKAEGANETPETSEWPRPVFGYTGTLHRERIDLDLVLQLARAHPGGSVVLVGPQHWTDDSLKRAIETQPNLHAPGPVPYSQIPEVMARFDVCIVPHRRSEFVESLNPIKLWEYLAAGKPIVSTDVAGFRDYPQLVHLADDAPKFIAACRAALGEIGTPEGAELKEARRAEAAQHGWSARVDDLLNHWREAGF